MIRDGITTTLFYTLDGSVLSEHHSGGTLNGLRVTNAFDSFLLNSDDYFSPVMPIKNNQ